MELNFNYNSKTARFYKWFYAVPDYEIPNNLCTYFWYLVFAVLWTLIFGILYLPVAIYYLFSKEKKDESIPMCTFIGSVISFILYLVVSFFVFWINYLFLEKFSKDAWYTVPGIFTSGVSSIFLIAWIISSISKKNKGGISVIGSYIKAKKQKICPKINWNNGNIRTKENQKS